MYICSLFVSDILFLFPEIAPPHTPFPVIKYCMVNSEQTAEGNCSLHAVSAVNLTCSIWGYYPDITLYFRHDSVRLKSIQTKEWNNTDWTRNKEITVAAEPSDVPYTCVAADVPGSRDQEQVTSIFLYAPPDGITTHDAMAVMSTKENGSNQNRMIGR